MLKAIGWDTLLVRRQLHDAVMFYKIQTGVVHINLPPIVQLAHGSTRRQHDLKYRIPTSTCTTYQHSFYIRMIPLWNALPKQAVTAETVPAFQAAALPAIRQM